LTGILDGLVQVDEDSPEKILISMVDEKNLPMKTDIEKPRAMSQLEFLASWLEIENAPDSAELVKKYVQFFKVNRVSYKRKSREEVIRGLIGIEQNNERSLTQKLTASPEEKK
jgi:hypothetical protein